MAGIVFSGRSLPCTQLAASISSGQSNGVEKEQGVVSRDFGTGEVGEPNCGESVDTPRGVIRFTLSRREFRQERFLLSLAARSCLRRGESTYPVAQCWITITARHKSFSTGRRRERIVFSMHSPTIVFHPSRAEKQYREHLFHTGND